MNWSSEWNKPVNNPEFIKRIDAEFDIEFGKNVKLTIPIENDWPRTVEAIQIGDLAVHEDIKDRGLVWQVTHVLTLTRFNVVPAGLHKKADLIEWCKKVQASNIEDWKELAKMDHSCYKERSDAKDRIMYLCQGVAI